MPRPLLLLASAFAAGALTGARLGLPECALLLALAGGLLALGWAAPRPWASAGALAGAAMALGAAGAGIDHARYQGAPLLSWQGRETTEHPVEIEGTALTDAAASPQGRTLVVA